MNVLLLTALLVSSVWASPFPKLRTHPRARIVGGDDAYTGQFPFAAAIQYITNYSGEHFCGGALLTNQWILTSASCVEDALFFSICLGTANLDDTGPNVVRVTTDRYVIHPDYKRDTLENDIGLIQLRYPVEFTEYVQPIVLQEKILQTYAVVNAIGWGQISDEDLGIVDILQTLKLSVQPKEECKLYYGNRVKDTMVCAKGSYNEGTCIGDTGTPLIQVYYPPNNNTNTLVGVSSFSREYACESLNPSVYTRVFPYLEWITSIITNTV